MTTLAPLATSSNVEDRLGRALTDSELSRIDSLLLDASAKVRSVTAQEIGSRESTDRIRITARDGHIRLPQYPVAAVASVISVETGSGLPYYWDGLVLWGWGRFPNSNVESPLYNRSRRHGVVADVTYTHGYDPIPDDIVAVVAQAVARSLGASPDQSGVMGESFDGYSYTLGAAAAAGGLGLLPAEQAVLVDYAAPNAEPISMI